MTGARTPRPSRKRKVTTPIPLESEVSFIDKVVNAAAKKFIPGPQNSKKFRDAVEKQNKKKKSNPIQITTDCYTAIKDADFKRSANKIIGTNFIAAPGPKNATDLADFFDDTVFNKKSPIHHVIALGDKLYRSDERPKSGDFYDYCTHKEEFRCDRYHVFIKRLYGKSQTINHTKSKEDKKKGTEFHQPRSILQAKLYISPIAQDENDKSAITKELNVTLIKQRDCRPYKIGKDKSDKKKDKLWQLYLLYLENSILVHCHAGAGRTGQLILTFEILKNYHKVFSSDDPEIVADNILKLLDHLRSDRKALVHKESQLRNAILNAKILHDKYANELKEKSAHLAELAKIPQKKGDDNLKVTPISLFFQNPSKSSTSLAETKELKPSRPKAPLYGMK